LAPDVACSALERYLGWYWEGVHRPLLVLPKASYAFALKHCGGKSDPLKAAWTEWNGNSYREIPGDKDDPYLQLVMRGVTADPIESPDFAMLAEEFYGRVLRTGELQ
jgi:exonuclease V gamma subunit